MPSAAKGKAALVATKSAAATPESIAAAMVKTVRDNNHIGLFDALTVVSTEQEKEAIQRFFTKAQTAADESVSGTTVLNVLFGDGAYFVTRKASWTQAQIPNGAVFPIRSLRPGR